MKGKEKFVSEFYKKTCELVEQKQTEIENSPLISALNEKDKPRFNRLLKSGRDPNVKNKSGVPLVCLVVALQDSWLISSLMSAGADPDVLDLHGKTALMLAAVNDDEYVLLNLLNGGASVNLKDPSGKNSSDVCGRKEKRLRTSIYYFNTLPVYGLLTTTKRLQLIIQRKVV